MAENNEKRPRGHQKGVPNPNGGRKATGLKRVRFQVSCQPEEEAEIRRYAEEAGMSLSKYMVESALKRL